MKQAWENWHLGAKGHLVEWLYQLQRGGSPQVEREANHCFSQAGGVGRVSVFPLPGAAPVLPFGPPLPGFPGFPPGGTAPTC